MLNNILKEVKDNSTYVSIYTDTNNTSKFIFGQIISHDDEYFVVSTFSPEGRADGLLVKEISSIFRIEIDSKYSEKMVKLIKLNSQNHSEYKLDEKNILKSVLIYAKENGFIISVELLSSGYDDIIGIVESFENGLCSIKQIDEYGKEEGISYINISDITQISCNSSDEAIIQALLK